MLPQINTEVTDIKEALSIFLNQIVYDKKQNGERVYTYSLGEAFFEIPRFELSDEEFYSGYHYSSSRGQIALRRKIAELYNNRYHANVDPEHQIIISAGSKPLVYMLLRTVLLRGEEVLVHEPAWLSYIEDIKLAGCKYVGIPYNESVKNWEKYITDKSKVIIINNPNNPSGQLYTEEELNMMLDFAKKYNLFILSDEAYSDFLPNDKPYITFANIDKTMEHTLIVNSLSKNMGMSGWRVGYSITHKDIANELLKLNQHLITCAPTVLQNYLAKHFDEIMKHTLPQAEETAHKRMAVQKIMDEIGIKYLKGIGTFYFMVDVSDFKGTTNELVFELLLNNNISTVSGEAYGFSTKDFIRFAIGVESLEDIRKSLLVIKHYLDMKSYDPTKIHELMKKYGAGEYI